MAKRSPNFDKKDPPALQLRHDMARAKIIAYEGNGGELAKCLPRQSAGAGGALWPRDRAVPARLYRRGGANHRQTAQGAAKKRLSLRDQGRNADAGRQGARGGRRLQQGDRAGQVQVGPDPRLSSATPCWRRAIRRCSTRPSPKSRPGLRAIAPTPPRTALLARAYSARGEPDMARSAAAEEAYYKNQLKDAKRLAQLAQPKLKQGSPEWLRMQDILDYKPAKK